MITWDLRPVTWKWHKILHLAKLHQNLLHFVKKQYQEQMMACSDWMTIQLTGQSIYTIHKQHTHLTLKMASKTPIENVSHNYVLCRTTLTGTKIPSS